MMLIWWILFMLMVLTIGSAMMELDFGDDFFEKLDIESFGIKFV